MFREDLTYDGLKLEGVDVVHEVLGAQGGRHGHPLGALFVLVARRVILRTRCRRVKRVVGLTRAQTENAARSQRREPVLQAA